MGSSTSKVAIEPTTNTNNDIININENAHSKMMRDMSKYLDECKNYNISAQCTVVLEYHKDEQDPNKKWSFSYQCDRTQESVIIIKALTKQLLNNADNFVNACSYN